MASSYRSAQAWRQSQQFAQLREPPVLSIQSAGLGVLGQSNTRINVLYQCGCSVRPHPQRAQLYAISSKQVTRTYSRFEKIFFIKGIVSFPHKVNGPAQFMGENGHGLALAMFLFVLGDKGFGTGAFAHK